jgi:hypothetical protein
MVQVVVTDKDAAYCDIVCSRLNSRGKNYLFNSIHAFEDLSANLFSGMKITPECLSGFFDLKKTVFIVCMSLYFKLPADIWKIMLVPGEMNEESGIEHIGKYSSVNDFFKGVAKFITDNPDLSLVPQFNGMECITGNACERLKKGYVKRISAKKLSDGYKVVILDLSPPYLSGSTNFNDTNHTLTDALLRILADDFSYKDIGQYLTSTGEGVLHFRPAEKTDDLFECAPKDIGRLIESIKEWIKHTQYSYYFFINCSNIPFSFIYTTAILCDCFTILNVKNDHRQNSLYNNELSYLTANIPSSCKVKFESLPCSLTLDEDNQGEQEL